MKNKGIILGIFSLAIIGAAAYGSGVFAAQIQGRGMGQLGANKTISEQDSARFAQMHNLMVEGKFDEANAIRTDLGLGQGGGRRGMMGGRANGDSQQRGQNRGGNFVDANNDGICDHMQQ